MVLPRFLVPLAEFWVLLSSRRFGDCFFAFGNYRSATLSQNVALRRALAFAHAPQAIR